MPTPPRRRPRKGAPQLSEGEETLALHLRGIGAPPPRRQHCFAEAIGREWRFDFSWPERRLAVEIEGEQHRIQSRFRSDLEKYNAAQLMGWTVLRFRPSEVKSGHALAVIEAALADSDKWQPLFQKGRIS